MGRIPVPLEEGRIVIDSGPVCGALWDRALGEVDAKGEPNLDSEADAKEGAGLDSEAEGISFLCAE